ncbi:MAG: hypothetical protein L6Q98_22260 [Anaerolineae bacterium]|nr:hypothetical protein [Anaerolineae bacterium]NUQ04884.1 hypothetical protein [Anaerolineae bacterium]
MANIFMAVKAFDKRFWRDADQFAFPFVNQVGGSNDESDLIGMHFSLKGSGDM